jgi:CysZ protein
MNFFSDFGKGVSYHLKAWSFIAKNGLWLYFLYPVFLVIILYVLGFYSVFNFGNYLSDKILGWIPDYDGGNSIIGAALSAIISVLKIIAGLVIKLYLLAIILKFAKYIVLILCSPMMALLSERIDEIISGKKYPFEFSQFLKDIFRGIKINLRNLLLETLITIAFLFIGWIPVIGWVTIPFLWIISWYFLGFNMMDYSYERRRMKISEGVNFTRKHKGIAVGNGMIFSWLLLIPFLGLIIAPVLSVTAGTLATLEALEKN